MELLRNKKAFFDYEVIEKFTAGIALLGHEVKSIRAKKINLKGGWVSLKNGEVWLENVQISPYQPKNQPEENSMRKRKLLLNAREIARLDHHSQTAGITLIPLRILLEKNRIKIEVGICRGKKKYDKRDSIKKRELDRRLKRIVK